MIENISGSKRLKQSDKQLAKDGVLFKQSELYPQLPVSKDNFAESKYVSSLFDFEIIGGSAVYNQSADRDRLLLAIEIPNDLSFNGWKHDSPYSVSFNRSQLKGKALIDKLDTIVNQDFSVIQEIDSKVNRKSSVVRLQTDANQNPFILMPHLSDIRAITKFSRCRAFAAIEKGDRETALTCFKTIQHMSDLCDSTPALISMLIKIVILESGQDIIWHGMTNNIWTENDYRNFVNWLPTTESRGKNFSGFANGELVFSRSILESFLHSKRKGRKQSADLFGPDYWWMAYLPKGAWKHNLAHSQEAVFHHLYLPSKKLDFTTTPTHTIPSGTIRRTFLAKLTTSAFTRSRDTMARYLVHEKLTKIACAIRLYQMETGELPSNLKALVPNYIENTDDLMNPGSALTYRIDSKKDQNWTVYSIGNNLVDDGGLVVWKTNGNRDFDVGDWVCSIPLTQKTVVKKLKSAKPKQE